MITKKCFEFHFTAPGYSDEREKKSLPYLPPTTVLLWSILTKKKLKNKYFVSRANEMAIYVAFVVRLAVYDLNEFE